MEIEMKHLLKVANVAKKNKNIDVFALKLKQTENFAPRNIRK